MKVSTKPEQDHKADVQQTVYEMRFSLPGQLRGPECNRVMQQAIALRKMLEPRFADIDGGSIVELGIALRVDGSLGSFGQEGVENIAVEDGKIECDVVIADQGWAELGDADIATILKYRVLDAVNICFATVGVSYDADALTDAAS